MASDRDVRPPAPDDGLRHEPMRWPTPGQLLRQLAIIVVIAGVWGGALVGVVRFPSSFVSAAADGPPSPARAARMAARAARDSADREGGTAMAAGDSAQRADSAPVAAAPTGKTAAPSAVEAPARGVRAEAPSEVAHPEVVRAEAAKPDTPPSGTGNRVVVPATTVAKADPPEANVGRTVAAKPPGTTPRSEAEGGREPRPKPAAETLDLLMEVPDSAAADVSFVRDVFPILERRCLQCHGGERKEGGLRIEEGLDMRTHRGLMLGSTWGTVVEPGDPVASYLLELVLSGEMPDEGPRLLPGEIRVIRNWILAGAHAN